MKTVVIIAGTNGTGKSTLARSLIEAFGGIECVRDDITFCRDRIHAFAGEYGGGKYGGVDAIKNSHGSSCTSRLAGIVKEALQECDTVICEGMMLHTFGINISNAFFLGDRQLFVLLYAPGAELNRRLLQRSGNAVTKKILQNNLNAANAARKWASIGVPVISFDTSKVGVETIRDAVICKIQTLSQ